LENVYLYNKSFDDGINPSICYATDGGKVIVYSPHLKLFDEFSPDEAANKSKFE